MAEFTVPVVRITGIDPIEGADAIEVAQVLGYRCVVKKGEFNVGDLAVYIPEAAIVPDNILEAIGLTGKLAGPNGNRVKAIRLRGVVSQGLLLKPFNDPTGIYVQYVDPETGIDDYRTCVEGDDLAEFLGITKYEPPVPTHLAGEVKNLFGKTLKYDIENIQKYPDVLEPGELVVMTEKLHGTWCCLARFPGLDDPELLDGVMFAASKGQSEQGLVFKHNEKNAGNLYHKTLLKYQAQVTAVGQMYNQPVYVLGEVFGPVQDLTYGLTNPEFRVFDIYVGEPGKGKYLDDDAIDHVCTLAGFERVPLAYLGPYSKEVELSVRDGKTLFDAVDQIREGVVIKPVRERTHPLLGRVQLKSVSPDYLLRKGKKGQEVTEYQ